MDLLPFPNSDLTENQKLSRNKQIDKAISDSGIVLSNNIEIRDLQKQIVFLANIIKGLCNNSL